MDIQDVINDTNYSVRTQISLSPSLYRLLKQQARKEEKSLAAFVRDNVIASLRREEIQKKADSAHLENLANLVHTVKGKSGWAKVKNPHKLIRKWRAEEENHWMKKVGLKP